MKYIYVFVCLILCHAQLFAQIGHLLTASDGKPQDLFGRSVDISGNFAIVGADGDDFPLQSAMNVGSAYIYQYDGKRWQFFQKITPANASGNERFGYSVAIDGHTAVIGAVSAEGITIATGAAYIFNFNGIQWVESEKIVASDGQIIDFFGHAVDVSGDMIIVGAPNEGSPQNRIGAAYFFQWADTGWTELIKINPSDSVSGGFFGRSVSISGNKAVVGAPLYPNAVHSPGQAYVFNFDDEMWSEQQILQSSDAILDDNFGYAVDIDAEQLIVTSPFISGPSYTAAAAYVFNFADSIWIQHQKATSPENPNNAVFGVDVAIEGDLAIVGAHLDEQGQRGGAAYVFEKQNENWKPFTRLTGSDFSYMDISFTEFGNPVALSGRNCIAGVLDTSQVQSDEGAALIVELDVPLNDQFSEVTTVHCGDTIWQSTRFANHLDVPDTCLVGFPQTPGLWYHFEGNGEIITASLCGSNIDTRMAAFVEDIIDTELRCITGDNNTCNLRSSIVFSTELNKNYYIYISSSDSLPGNFELTIECNVPECNTAPVSYTDQIGLTDVRINWNPVPGSLQYEVVGAVLGGPSVTILLPASKTKFIINNLTPGETYTWRVRSICDPSGIEKSPFSVAQYFTALTVCPGPASLWTTYITDTSARLNWSSVPVASWYRVVGTLILNPNASWEIDVYDPFKTYLDVSGIAPGFAYRWSIITNCGVNASVPQAFDTFTTTLPLNPKVDDPPESASIQTHVRIFPNPASDHLNIYLRLEDRNDFLTLEFNPLQVRIYDQTGRKILSTTLEETRLQHRIELPKELEDGIYHVAISGQGNHQLHRIAIIK